MCYCLLTTLDSILNSKRNYLFNIVYTIHLSFTLYTPLHIFEIIRIRNIHTLKLCIGEGILSSNSIYYN